MGEACSAAAGAKKQAGDRFAAEKPLIEFADFSFKYRAQTLPTLKNINLKIFPGEKVLIAGPSGSGKSTIAHCINGLAPFNYKGTCTGFLSVGGTETKDIGVFGLSKIVGTALQDTDGQFVGLTAGEDIAFALENDCTGLDEMRGRVSGAAKMTGIGDALDASPFDLSGGQKQRVSIAGILVDKVRVLLFDEPLANLDPATGKSAIELIDRVMRETGAAAVIIEHRIEDALHRGVDRVVIMDDGQIVADVSVKTLLCGDTLRDGGMREPLYITALKYAGVSVTPEHAPERIETLKLCAGDAARVREWHAAGTLIEPTEKKAGLLRVDGASFAYEKDGKKALVDISLEIREGEMLAIVGTNGAGKSTLAKLICGFEKPDEGKFYWRGDDFTNMSIPARAERIGYVMQNPNQMICKPFVFDEIAYGLRNKGMLEREVALIVDEMLKVCGLRPFVMWPISALSYGQKKRVTIASVLAQEPELLILDEPTAGQDFKHYTEFMEFLRFLNLRGAAVLMITHDMHLMLEYAPRALVLSGGRLIADVGSAALLCDARLTSEASLKETSLFNLAKLCAIEDAVGFVNHFVEYDRKVRFSDGA